MVVEISWCFKRISPFPYAYIRPSGFVWFIPYIKEAIVVHLSYSVRSAKRISLCKLSFRQGIAAHMWIIKGSVDWGTIWWPGCLPLNRWVCQQTEAILLTSLCVGSSSFQVLICFGCLRSIWHLLAAFVVMEKFSSIKYVFGQVFFLLFVFLQY